MRPGTKWARVCVRQQNQTERGENAISYLVCHMEKYHKTDIAPIEKENERNENYEAKNPQINRDLTVGNYHILRREESYTDYINQRLAENNLKPRKDAVLMCSFVIGSDRDFFSDKFPQEEDEFFTEATRYFAEKYGTENIISAVVHMDETTPHLHLNLIPISDGRLCAKDLFCPKNLRDLQTELHERVGRKFGLERGKINSQAEHLSSAEFKAKKIVEQAEAENKRLIKENTEAREQFYETQGEIQRARKERDEIVSQRNAEADYSHALEEAKSGVVSHGKKEMRDQIVALTAENKRLESENARLAKDNGDLFQQLQKSSVSERKAEVARNAMLAVRQHEPEAFARTFFKSTALIQPFIDLFSAPIPLPRNRVREIEQELEWEKRQEQLKSKSSWSK